MFLSVPDGVPFGVMPPAAYFSRGRKVGKSPLRTNGSKDSSPDVYCQSLLTIFPLVPPTLR